jgi:transglutaminase/protease-like cytokinesis protein 3
LTSTVEAETEEVETILIWNSTDVVPETDDIGTPPISTSMDIAADTEEIGTLLILTSTDEAPETEEVEKMPLSTSTDEVENEEVEKMPLLTSIDVTEIEEAETSSRHPDKNVETKASMKRHKKKRQNRWWMYRWLSPNQSAEKRSVFERYVPLWSQNADTASQVRARMLLLIAC